MVNMAERIKSFIPIIADKERILGTEIPQKDGQTFLTEDGKFSYFDKGGERFLLPKFGVIEKVPGNEFDVFLRDYASFEGSLILSRDEATYKMFYVDTSGAVYGDIGPQGKQGPKGNDGYNTILITYYQRSATTPAAATFNVIYNFRTGVTTATPTNNWQATIPSSNGNPLWSTSVFIRTQSTLGSSSSFSTPVKLFEAGPGIVYRGG